MTLDFPRHVAGEPYILTREQFAAFASISLPDDDADEVAVIAAFWAGIAAFEARRVFNRHSSLCYSDLAMSTEGRGFMRWEYHTTSGTVLHASEWREMLPQPIPGYNGPEYSWEAPEPIFQVTIPADRDQPGWYCYDQLRNGGAYCS